MSKPGKPGWIVPAPVQFDFIWTHSEQAAGCLNYDLLIHVVLDIPVIYKENGVQQKFTWIGEHCYLWC